MSGEDAMKNPDNMFNKGEATVPNVTKTTPPPPAQPRLAVEPGPSRSPPDPRLRPRRRRSWVTPAYKAKNFDVALEHYDKAIALDGEDISFITNKAAVYFEKGDFDSCVKACDDAVPKGRELRVDYKLVGKAMTRKGNALVKLGRLEDAIEVYGKSLMEHRNADTLKRLNETERELKERKRSVPGPGEG